MDKSKRKELAESYKESEVRGGVYLIRNAANNRALLESSTNLDGSINRFEFSKKTGSCVSLKLQREWTEYGAENFSLEILEELKKGENQTDAEFKEDIDALKEIWRENLSGENILY